MKLTVNNIKFVKRMESDGITYEWFVAMKSNRVSDSRMFINYENNRTVVKEFGIDRLPAIVRKFVETHKEEVFSATDNHTVYIFR